MTLPAIHELAGTVNVPAIGARRRLQALTLRGWSVPRLAALAGVDRQCLDGALRKENIYARTHVAVTALYDRLWDQRPPETCHRERISAARSRNGPQPTVGLRRSPGNDDRIDDPTLTETEKHAKARELLAGGLTVKAVTTRARLDRKTVNRIRDEHLGGAV